MDEARRVLARLERIERLDREATPATALLEELRALVQEAEAWARVERADVGDAVGALRRRLDDAEGGERGSRAA